MEKSYKSRSGSDKHDVADVFNKILGVENYHEYDIVKI